MTHQAITGAWYLAGRRELDVMFPGGRRYRYANVPIHVARGFGDAASKGAFFNRQIRNRYPCRELGEELEPAAQVA